MRKHLFSFLALWLCAMAGLQAQGVLLGIHGQVTTVTGSPVAFQPIIILDPSSPVGGVLGTPATTINGYYMDSVLAPAPMLGTVGILLVMTSDSCSGQMLVDSVVYTAGGQIISGLPANFVTCTQTTPACSVFLSHVDLGGNSYTFTANSTITSATNIVYMWDMGDGNTYYHGPTGTGSTDVVTHTYNAPGTYTVTVTVYDSIYCQATAWDAVYPGLPGCQAAFYGYYDSTNSTIFLNDYSYTSSGGPLTYSWTFSNGMTSNLQNPVLPGVTGVITACLTISDATGTCTSTQCDSIFPVLPPSCAANFTYTTSASGNTVAFTDLSTFANPAGSHSYFWDLGDGTTSTLQNPVHTYPGPGLYYVNLYISDSLSGCYDYSFQTVAVGFNSSCAAVFSYWGNGNTQNFYPYSLVGPGPSATASFTWDFGDGNTGAGYSPTHTYAQSGVYNVCLTIADSACSFTWCDSVYVGNYWGCDASFGYYEKGAYGLVDFYGNNWSWSASESWDFGDGTTGNGGWPTHQYAADGNYTVCHIVTDSLANCTDTFCTQITVTTASVAGGCQTSFFWTPDMVDSLKILLGGQYFNLFGGTATTWSWSFGDGTSSTQQNPDHTYAASGTYLVCLTATDSMGCTSTFCDSVFVNTFPVSSNSISGIVTAGQQLADNATVYLVTLDPVTFSLVAVDSTTIQPSDSGQYFFNGIASNMYTVKAALNSTSANFAGYMPTYFGDNLFWLDAQWFFIPGYVPQRFDINLAAGANTGGPGFIGGSIFAGANKNGKGMAGVDIMLMDQNMNPVAHTKSDENGDFGFAGLPLGNYMVYVDMMNRTTDPAPVSLKQGAHQVNNIEIEVGATEITFSTSGTTGISSDIASQVGNVYPNPTTGIAALDLTLERAADIRIEVVSVLGTSMWTSNATLAAGKHTLPVTLEDLPTGVYMVRVLNGDAAVAIRRVVKD